MEILTKPITEFYLLRKDGTILVITKPTNNCYIKQVETGQLYSEAIDVGYFGLDKQYHATKYTYESTNILIEEDNKDDQE